MSRTSSFALVVEAFSIFAGFAYFLNNFIESTFYITAIAIPIQAYGAL